MSRKNKCNCPPAGAPAWVATFGDMMSLLLTFFILLVSLSEIKKEDQWKAIIEEVQKSFGMRGGGGKLPTKEDPELSFMNIKETVQMEKHREPNEADTEEVGVDGSQAKVTRVREGLIFVQGGRIIFEPGSADLNYRAMRQLDSVAKQLKGKNNVIEVRGHAASLELAGGSDKFTDLENLSYMRTKAVVAYLVQDHPDLHVRRERFRLIAVADHEPLVHRDYTIGEQEPNRRVEVFEDEVLIQDFRRPERVSQVIR